MISFFQQLNHEPSFETALIKNRSSDLKKIKKKRKAKKVSDPGPPCPDPELGPPDPRRPSSRRRGSVASMPKAEQPSTDPWPPCRRPSNRRRIRGLHDQIRPKKEHPPPDLEVAGPSSARGRRDLLRFPAVSWSSRTTGPKRRRALRRVGRRGGVAVGWAGGEVSPSGLGWMTTAVGGR